MKKTLFVLALAVTLSVATSAAFAASADSDTCIKKGGTWDDAKKTCALVVGVEIKVNYPIEVTKYPFAEKIVDDYLKATREAFLAEFNKSGTVPLGAATWGMDVSYEPFQRTHCPLAGGR